MARRNHRRQPMSLASALIFLTVTAPSRNGVAADGPSAVADSKCDCFVSNGSDVAYFSHHKFFDFRSLPQFQGTPALLQDGGATTNAPVTSTYFTNDSFTSFWQAQNWNNSESANASNATVLRINSLNNIFIEKNTDANPSSATWLTLRTARQSAFQSTAEIATQTDTYQYISMRMLARTIGSPGGCTAMFTYRAPPDGSSGVSGGGSGAAVVQEVDLEVLTKYPREHVQCTNQPALDKYGQTITLATQNVTLPGGLGWDDWAVYRLDWTPSQSTWYVSGQQIANISFQTPRDPTRIHINAWSDGSNWTGSMAPNTEAHLQIQWWELLYNSTAPTGKNSCNSVCSIDANGPTGQAVLVLSSMASVGPRSAGGSLISWVPSVVIALVLYTAMSP